MRMSVTLIEHMGRAYGSGTQPPVNPRDTLLTPRLAGYYPELKNTQGPLVECVLGRRVGSFAALLRASTVWQTYGPSWTPSG